MNKEELREFARQEFINNVMTNLDSGLIFTYIQNLEQENKQLQTKIDRSLELLDKLNIQLKDVLKIKINIKEISDIKEILKGEKNE